MPKIISVLFLSVLLSAQAHAGEHRFETTAKGIIDALTRPAREQPAQPRSLTRSFSPMARAIKVVRKDQGKTVEETVIVGQAPSDQSVNLKLEFDYNSYAIRPGSFGLLSELGKALTSDEVSGKDLVIKGHTDSDGSDSYNLRLSLLRAESVKMYLAANFNVMSSRLKIVGYGEAMPLVPNSNPGNKQLNRRVEIATTRTY